jgi:hypothetical protein
LKSSLTAPWERGRPRPQNAPFSLPVRDNNAEQSDEETTRRHRPGAQVGGSI